MIVVGKDALEYKVADNILGGVRNGILDGEEGNNILVGVGSRWVVVGNKLVVADSRLEHHMRKK